MFLEESKEGGAAWTSIEPENDWISSWIILRLNINIMETLCICYWEVSGVTKSIKGNIWKVSD